MIFGRAAGVHLLSSRCHLVGRAVRRAGQNSCSTWDELNGRESGRVAMRKIYLVLGAVGAIACGGDSGTAPQAAPWQVGEWRAVSVNGRALPAKADTGTFAFRYDSLSLSVSSAVVHTYRYFGAVGTAPSALGCAATIRITMRGDTIRIDGANGPSTCAPNELDGLRFVRLGAQLEHVRNGHRFVFERR